MRNYVHSLEFKPLPDTINFSQLDPYEVDSFETTDKELLLELNICRMLHSLDNDKERCVFFFQLLRSDGYKFDYGSCAQSLRVNLRWYMRLKQRIQKKLEKFNIKP